MGSPRKVTLLLDQETLGRVERVREKMGFYKTSEAFRYVIRKGLEVVEAEAGQG